MCLNVNYNSRVASRISERELRHTVKCKFTCKTYTFRLNLKRSFHNATSSEEKQRPYRAERKLKNTISPAGS